MIKRPTLLLDENKCKSNILRMSKKAKQAGVIFRPHFKTHQSHGIGRWFRELGVGKITVSSMKMASFFAQDGWDDITVAFPVNIREIDLINDLAAKITLNLVVESAEVIQFLIDNLLAQLNFFIKIDPGSGRTGIQWDHFEEIGGIIKGADDSFALNFSGFLAHAGHTYSARNEDQILDIHTDYLQKLKQLKSNFLTDYPDLLLSVGDTPSCAVANEFGPADEIRPGNFVFFDLMQTQIGSCSVDDIAVAMACPVVAIHKARNTLIIHGGSIHFALDSIVRSDGQKSFGSVVESKEDGWGKIIKGSSLIKLSQEHGSVKLPSKDLERFSIGDIIHIVPVHSCTTSNLMKSYKLLEGKTLDHMEGYFQL